MIDVAIIGVGPAGIEAAREAKKQGLNVALVGMTPPGGRAAMGSLLPSKVWLHAADDTHAEPATAGAITGEIRTTQQSWTDSLADEFAGRNIPVHRGKAVLTSPTEVEVRSPKDDSVVETLTARFVLIATGSEPTFPQGVKPDGERIIAPRHTQALTEIPEHIVFVGEGVTATEYASAFARLGSKVEIFAFFDRLLPAGEPSASAFITGYLQETLGVTIHRNEMVVETSRNGDGVRTRSKSGRVVDSDFAFIATGRHPDLTVIEQGPASLAQEFARTPDGGLRTDEYGRTNLETVFAAGDAAGAPLIANKATWQARRAIRYIAGADLSDLPPAENLVHAVYTNPQVAWIGSFSDLPQTSTDKVGIIEQRYDRLLLAKIDHATHGFLKLWYDRDSRAVMAASAAGQSAAELMTPIQLAMHRGVTIDQLSSIPGPHPTFGELISA